MAGGVPVITSNRSSLLEVAGDAALLVDLTQVEALATAISSVMTDGAMRQALRVKGLSRARAFSRATVAHQTLAIYRTVSGG
jgi:glycosyltransferase involved in cell wall biosynthesis